MPVIEPVLVLVQLRAALLLCYHSAPLIENFKTVATLMGWCGVVVW